MTHFCKTLLLLWPKNTSVLFIYVHKREKKPTCPFFISLPFSPIAGIFRQHIFCKHQTAPKEMNSQDTTNSIC